MNPVDMNDNGDVVFALDFEPRACQWTCAHCAPRKLDAACNSSREGGRQETASVPASDTDRYEELIDPGIPVPEIVTKLMGITDDMVHGQRTEADVVQALMAWMGRVAQGRNVYVVAYNADYDYKAINGILTRCGILELSGRGSAP